jgi:hypothetical protein
VRFSPTHVGLLVYAPHPVLPRDKDTRKMSENQNILPLHKNDIDASAGTQASASASASSLDASRSRPSSPTSTRTTAAQTRKAINTVGKTLSTLVQELSKGVNEVKPESEDDSDEGKQA